MLFNGVWTAFIATPYLAFAPTYFPNLAHRLIVVAVDVITMVFWFAGFIALAAHLPSAGHSSSSACSSLQAATVFGSFEWYVCRRALEDKMLTKQNRALFAVTSAVAAMGVVRSRPSSSKPTPQTAV